MYVIFPAEEVVDLTLGYVTTPHQQYCPKHQPLPEGILSVRSREPSAVVPDKQDKKAKKKIKFPRLAAKRGKKQQDKDIKMAAGGEVTLRDLTHPTLNEALKAHNSVTFKLVRTVSDFTQQLSQVYEQHAEELQLLVASFRKRNAELRKERPAGPSALFHTWETLLQEVEVDSQAHADIASVLGRQVSRPLLERSFHRKIQSRKVFTHRESYETILSKTEDKLAKCRQDYKSAYLTYLGGPSTVTLASYLDAHNDYVTQLHATNGMLERYHQEALPQLLQELEEVYSDLCSTLSESVLQGSEIISSRAMEQTRRYEGLSSQCRAVSGPPDLAHFVRSLPSPGGGPQRPALRHNFVPPQPPPPPDTTDGTPGEPVANEALNPPPPLKNEIVVDRLASVAVRGRYEALRKEALELETQIKQLQDALDTLLRIQQRSLESNLFNKANELQEDISMKRFDLRVAQIHLGAVRAQKELFASKAESASDTTRERKMSSSSTGSMKNKWLKAFKSLKTTGNPGNGAANKDNEKKNQMYHAVSTIMSMRKNGKERDASQPPESVAHIFQEYTYKKITPCDACSQVLRGHTRQGLKCRTCKLNVHADCQDKLGRCQPKSRLLRRQKSTSEIETRLAEPLDEENVSPEPSRRRRLFAGMKSVSMFGNRGRGDSPSHSRSISLPESRGPGSGVGTRPFGQPLCLSETINENGCVTPSTPTTPLKSKQNRLSK